MRFIKSKDPESKNILLFDVDDPADVERIILEKIAVVDCIFNDGDFIVESETDFERKMRNITYTKYLPMVLTLSRINEYREYISQPLPDWRDDYAHNVEKIYKEMVKRLHFLNLFNKGEEQ